MSTEFRRTGDKARYSFLDQALPWTAMLGGRDVSASVMWRIAQYRKPRMLTLLSKSCMAGACPTPLPDVEPALAKERIADGWRPAS